MEAFEPLRAERLVTVATGAAAAAKQFVAAAKAALAQSVIKDGRISSSEFDRRQRVAHGFAWIATLSECLSATASWCERRGLSGGLDRLSECAIITAFSEYLGQLIGGVPMTQNEIVRPFELGLSHAAADLATNDCVAAFLRADWSRVRMELTRLLTEGHRLNDALDDDTLDSVRVEVRRFADERIIPNAHKWHLEDALIPDEIVQEIADLGIFGICIAPEFGGLGLGKLAMCVVTEELSRAWIAAGSLGTRSEIAAELIAHAGTGAQKRKWLPKIASGEFLPTAVFTEPDTGSDLGSIRTRGIRQSDGSWRIFGAKTWITHASRSDLMTVLARTLPETPGSAGLSIFVAEKPRGNPGNPFPVRGMSGSEIEVLGYRGMREYDVAFDGFEIPEDGLLGNAEGHGFKQLMRTFEAARVQTAARAVGVSRRALELGLAYAMERKQFGKSIAEFPRISDKLATMFAEILLAREVTYSAARAKEAGRRCDIEAGMAKLIAARVAWTAADVSLQIHGGNGYALEYEISRVLCDARILNIFEGAAEIQAQVVARGLLSRGTM
ncbi:acyl-CoA dehydrogenase family protein [Bradyrhizobium sp. UFLA05-109]